MEEKWQKTYEKEVEIYDTFSECEDEGNKILKKLLENFSFKDKIVLDIGCGSGKYVKLIAPLCKKYYALDISKPLLKLAKKKCKNIHNIEYIHANSENILLKNESVDVVFSSWGLIGNIEKIMQEIMRVLKKGGEIWSFGNYPPGEFMKMRGASEIKWEKNFLEISKKYSLKIYAIVNTNFKFPNLNEAKRILGFIFGKKALNYLEKNPNPKIKHKAVILHKVKQAVE